MRFASKTKLVRVDLSLAAFRKRKTSLGAVARKQYFGEMDQASGGRPKYPNFIWKLCKGKRVLIQILRLLRIL